TRRRDPRAVGAVREPYDRVLMAVQSEEFTGIAGPSQGRSGQDLADAFRAAYRQRVTVRAERQAVGPPSDDIERERFLPRPQIPDLHAQVVPRACQALLSRGYS